MTSLRVKASSVNKSRMFLVLRLSSCTACCARQIGRGCRVGTLGKGQVGGAPARPQPGPRGAKSLRTRPTSVTANPPSQPPRTSYAYTLPLVLMATMCVCCVKTLPSTGSAYSPSAFLCQCSLCA